MKNNIGDIVKNHKFYLKRNVKIFLIVIFLVIINFLFSGCSVCITDCVEINSNENEIILTNLYADDVSRIIENFYSQWMLFEKNERPDLMYTIAASNFVNEFMQPKETSSFLSPNLTSSVRNSISKVNVNRIRVIDYSSSRFRAIGCLSFYWNLPDETSETKQFDETILFVFEKSDGHWKLSGMLNISNTKDALRDLDYSPEWLKQVIGELPYDNLTCDIE